MKARRCGPIRESGGRSSKYKVNSDVLGADRRARAQSTIRRTCTKYDLSSLKHVFLAGEPLDQPTHEWFMGELGSR